MAASTITRTSLTLTNDTGTASSPNGDGTLLNAALWTLLLDRIDALFSGALTVGGVVSSEGFGSHNFSSGGTGGNILTAKNTTAGTGNFAQVGASNNSSLSVFLRMLSSTYTTSSYYVQGGGVLESNGTGGLSIVTSHVSGTLRVYTAGTLRSTWDTLGGLTHNGALALAGSQNKTITGTEAWVTGVGSAFLVRITSATSTPILAGIYAPVAGRSFLVTNQSSAAFTIEHESGSVGDPTFRFACPGNANVNVDDGDTVLIHYSDADSRWLVLGI